MFDWITDVEDDSEDDERRVLIEARLETLQELMKVEAHRLHAIEQMMANDLLAENRHLKCAGCLKLLDELIRKLQGWE